ncbi:MAG: hypothetical protein JXR60_03245 [Bacteroidales bacterium]|nr:hypothetical protein [Bacteroidales bacterium]
MTLKNNDELERLESDLIAQGKRLETLIQLSNDISFRERRKAINFDEFLNRSIRTPRLVFRDIFQLIHDAIHYYVPEGTDEYPEDKNSIGFLNYNFSKLFEEQVDTPFFADRLFANRLIKLFNSFRTGTQKNRIYLFEGPPGSGKSTFLKNLLYKLEEYSKESEGELYKTHWRIDINKLHNIENISHLIQIKDEKGESVEFERSDNYLSFSCPNHDHPILQVPKQFRANFLQELIPDSKFKKDLFSEPQYEWVFTEEPCSVCNSIHHSLHNIIENPVDIYKMIYAKPVLFNRQLGEGISVFNPGDPVYRQLIENYKLQSKLDQVFDKTSISYKHSYYAKTNNGVFALMDIKENNIERLQNLHGIISDGIHKVDLKEERVKSFFVGLVNPSDKKYYEDIPSFKDRVITIKIPYVLDYNTEVSIYIDKFGEHIKQRFLPKVLENFAKLVVATRLDINTPSIKKWIVNPTKYSQNTDKDLLLLKMDIYTGYIPDWLKDEDASKLTASIRTSIISDSIEEGLKGISGRLSINIFESLISKFKTKKALISQEDIQSFVNTNDHFKGLLTEGFLVALEKSYDYYTLQEVKNSAYIYNDREIKDKIANYLFALNFEFGEQKKSPYTNQLIEISEAYLENFEKEILEIDSSKIKQIQFRKEQHKTYIVQTLTKDIKIDNLPLEKTEQFNSLFEKYSKRLREQSLTPYFSNAAFRRAVSEFGSKEFNANDPKIKNVIQLTIKNLMKKYGYDQKSSQQIILYLIDKKIM